MVEKTYIIVGMEMKGMDVLYKKQILTLTRFWGDNRLCLYAKNPSQISIHKMEFVGGHPDEWCIFIDNLTDDEKAGITDIYGSPVNLKEDEHKF